MRSWFVVLLAVLSSCLPAEDYMEVRIQGEVRSSTTGAIELWLMHEQFGDGALQTRHAVIATKQLDAPGAFDWTVLVPLGSGSGVSLYGWQDQNGDGIHCLPGTETEPEATVLLSDAVSFDLRADLRLEPGCQGPK